MSELYVNPRGLYPFQAELVARSYYRPGNLAVVDTGLGKGLRKGTGVLRPDGSWTNVEDLTPGCFVVGSSGYPVEVVGVVDRGVLTGYRVTTDDGVSLVVDEDHLWTVSTDTNVSRGLPWRTVETRELAGDVDASDRKRWRIPVATHHGGGGHLPVSPYVLGVLLGDGHMGSGQIGFTVADVEIADRVESSLPESVILRRDVSDRSAPRYRIVGAERCLNPVLVSLRELGLAECRSWEKFVPAAYLSASEQDRRDLLAGLMDTDGWVGGAQQFTSTSERLAADVAYLVRSLGGVARTTHKETTFTDQMGAKKGGRKAYNVTIRMDRCPFSLSRKVASWGAKRRLGVTRKIASIEPIGEIESVCIRVDADDGLFITEGHVVTHNSHIAMALAALLVKDGAVDKVILVAEGNKLDEWRDDLAAFTRMSLNVFHGPKRKVDESDILLSTYSTLRDAMATAHPSDNRLLTTTEFTQRFVGKRILVIYDEMALLGTSRTSRTFRAHRMALECWRAAGADVRILGLTATPMSTTPECYYNLGLLLTPSTVGSFAQWCRDFVVGYDRWQKPNAFVHLDVFEQRLSTFMLRKRKTDADVKDQFPKLVEKAVYLTMHRAHTEAYEHLEAFLETVPDKKMLPAFRAINAFAAHPRSILSANWDVAQEWLDLYGRDKVTKIPAAKAQAIIGQLRSIDAQGDGGVIVFSHSVSALVALADDLRALPATELVEFVEFHGRQSDSKNAAAKATFKDGGVRVMLASSKAERGINLPEAHYIINLDVPTTHGSYIQRYNRGSRIGSNTDGTLMVKTYVTRNTIERATVNLWLKRNEWSDQLQDPRAGEDFTSALQRKMMVRLAGTSFDEDQSDLGW